MDTPWTYGQEALETADKVGEVARSLRSLVTALGSRPRSPSPARERTATRLGAVARELLRVQGSPTLGCVEGLAYSLIESAKLARVEPSAHLGEARRAICSPGSSGIRPRPKWAESRGC